MTNLGEIAESNEGRDLQFEISNKEYNKFSSCSKNRILSLTKLMTADETG